MTVTKLRPLKLSQEVNVM